MSETLTEKMANLGRLGGQARTPSKAAAARQNGLRGASKGGQASSAAKTAAARQNALKRWAKPPPAKPEGSPPLADEGRTPGRNESCPCGSGLKFKKCHGRAH